MSRDVYKRQLVDVAADLADPAVLLLELGGLRLDIGEIVGVGHGRHVGELPRLGDIGNEERVRLKLDGLRDPCLLYTSFLTRMTMRSFYEKEEL